MPFVIYPIVTPYPYLHQPYYPPYPGYFPGYPMPFPFFPHFGEEHEEHFEGRHRFPMEHHGYHR